MSFAKFKETYNEHLKYEIAAQNHILKYYNSRATDKYAIHEIQNENNYTTLLYDFSIKNADHIYKFEVKADLLSNKTHNYFIEYESSGKPSGIMTSTANYYIITNGEDYYCIKRSKLKAIHHQHLGTPALIRTSYEIDTRYRPNGDVRKPRYTRGVLIKTSVLNPLMVLINDISTTGEIIPSG